MTIIYKVDIEEELVAVFLLLIGTAEVLTQKKRYGRLVQDPV